MKLASKLTSIGGNSSAARLPSAKSPTRKPAGTRGVKQRSGTVWLPGQQQPAQPGKVAQKPIPADAILDEFSTDGAYGRIQSEFDIQFKQLQDKIMNEEEENKELGNKLLRQQLETRKMQRKVQEINQLYKSQKSKLDSFMQ